MEGEVRNTSRPTRTSKACDRCRRQKLKCDVTRPCVLCSRAGSICQTSSRTPRRSTRRQPRGANGSQTTNRVESPAYCSTSLMDTARPRPAASPFLPSTSGFAREKQQYNTNTSTIDFARRIFNEEETGREFTAATVPGDTGTSYPDQQSLWRLQEMELPPLPVMLALVDAYFYRVQWFILLFHETTLRKTAEGILSRKVWSRQELSSVMAVLSVALIGLVSVLPDQKWHGHDLLRMHDIDAHNLLHGLVAEIRLHLLDVVEDCRVEGVQTCILMSCYYVYHNSPNFAWSVFGMALRTAYALDMQIRASGKNPIADEIRTRCWNHIIVADTFSSLLYGRPVLIDSTLASLHPLRVLDDLEIDPWLLNHPLVMSHTHSTTRAPFHVMKTELSSISQKAIVRFRRLVSYDDTQTGEVDLEAVVQITQDADTVLNQWRERVPQLFDFQYWNSDARWDQIEQQLATAPQSLRENVEMVYLQSAILQLHYDAAVIQIHRPLLEQKIRNTSRSRSVLDATHRSLTAAASAAIRISRVPIQKLEKHFAASFASLQQFTAGIILCIPPTSQPFTTAAHEAKEGVMRIIHSNRALTPFNRIAKHTDHLLTELLKVTVQREMSRALGETMSLNPDRALPRSQATADSGFSDTRSEVLPSTVNFVDVPGTIPQEIPQQLYSEAGRGLMPFDFNSNLGVSQPLEFPSAHIFEQLDNTFGALGDLMFNLIPEDPNSSFNWGRAAP